MNHQLTTINQLPCFATPADYVTDFDTASVGKLQLWYRHPRNGLVAWSAPRGKYTNYPRKGVQADQVAAAGTCVVIMNQHDAVP